MKFLDDRYKTFLLWLGVAILTILFAYTISIILSALTAFFFLAAFWLARPLWQAPNTAYARIRIACVSLLAIISAYYLAPQHFVALHNTAIEIVNQSTHLHLTPVDTATPPIWILLIVVLGIGVIVHSLPDRTIMSPIVHPLDDLTRQQYGKDLLAVADLSAHRLGVLDRETNWSNRDFVSLDAEVEIHSLDRNQRRVGDLLHALRKETASEPILILGEPGSGKSVALRALCRELLKETAATQRLPLYINLKNWAPTIAWSEVTPPTVAEFREYIHSYIHREADDVFADRFLQKYFDQMLKDGTFFFIFDSFDEIPAVMDNPENSWIIASLSDVIGKFLRGAHASKGIVASRYFKRPTDRLGAGAIYRIKPFDDARIRKILQIIGGRSDDQTRDVYRSRPDLVAAATNPLVANLLATFVREHGGQWPANKIVLFSDHIQRQLLNSAVLVRMKDYGVTSEVALSASIAIATAMTKSEKHGLEIPVQILVAELPEFPTEHILQILKFARLGRISLAEALNFSFAHRRFQEFFVVVGMVKADVMPDVASIIADTRYRDILALYCEVASANGANAVAVHCWTRIKAQHVRPESRKEDSIEIVQALRFLIEAFSSRRDFTETFQAEFADYIREQLEGFHGGATGYQALMAKFASEAIALLDDARAGELFPIAVRYPSAWVRETAFRACRHLVTVSDHIKAAATDLILRYRHESAFGISLIRRHRELKFSLSISDGFRSVRHKEAAYFVDCYMLAISLGALLLLAPLVAMSFVGGTLFWTRVLRGNESKEALRLARRGELFFGAGGLVFIAAYVAGVGIVLSPSWWPSNPIFVWDMPLQAWAARQGQSWLLPVYKSAVIFFVIGMFPVAPTAVLLWQKPITISARLRGARDVSGKPTKKTKLNNVGSGLVDRLQTISLRDHLKFLSVVLGMIASVSALIWTAKFVWDWLGEVIIVSAMLGVVSIVILVKLGAMIAKSRARLVHDAKVLRSCQITSVMQRGQIQETLEQLQTEGGRLKLLSALLANHVVAIGAWRDEQLPFQPNDQASDELIRLEERWLRLDR